MTEELEQKAKDFIDRIGKESGGNWLDKYYLTDLLVMFATENGIQWHDLRKDPNDLPEANWKNWVLAVYDNGILWCRASREVFTDGVYWVNSLHNVIHDVIMWARIEIPQFKE